MRCCAYAVQKKRPGMTRPFSFMTRPFSFTIRTRQARSATQPATPASA